MFYQGVPIDHGTHVPGPVAQSSAEKSKETCLRHLDQKRKGSKSTKPKIVKEETIIVKEETIAPKEEIATTISDGKTN